MYTRENIRNLFVHDYEGSESSPIRCKLALGPIHNTWVITVNNDQQVAG